MKWVTRKSIRVNRTATAWLIRRFVDQEAQFLFVSPEEVAPVERQTGAIGFDAPGARFDNASGRTSFEQVLEAYAIRDPTLDELAAIVHAADMPGAVGQRPEAAGLQLISKGFPSVAKDDHDTVERAAFLYDALYAAVAQRQGVQRGGP